MEARTYFLSALVALLFVLANAMTKQSLSEGKEWLVLPLFLLGGTAFVVFRFVCKEVGLARSSAVVDSLLLLGTIAVAAAFFGEKLTVIQWIAILGIVVCLYLLR